MHAHTHMYMQFILSLSHFFDEHHCGAGVGFSQVCTDGCSQIDVLSVVWSTLVTRDTPFQSIGGGGGGLKGFSFGLRKTAVGSVF